MALATLRSIPMEVAVIKNPDADQLPQKDAYTFESMAARPAALRPARWVVSTASGCHSGSLSA
jgi:hypothetical protein